MSRCYICYSPKTIAILPWPLLNLPQNINYCFLCYLLENEAYYLWEQTYPELSKQCCPIPLINTSDYPQVAELFMPKADVEDQTVRAKEWIRKKMREAEPRYAEMLFNSPINSNEKRIASGFPFEGRK